MKMSHFLAFAMTAAAVAPAYAAKEPTSPVDPDKKICRKQETTGSIMTKRICHTKAEWAQIDKVNGQDAERALSKRRTGSNGAASTE